MIKLDKYKNFFQFMEEVKEQFARMNEIENCKGRTIQ